jgi:hypothetical protein
MKAPAALLFLLFLALTGCSEEEQEISIEESNSEGAGRSAGDFISFTQSVGKLGENGITVAIAGRGTLRGDRDYPLYLTGAGIRRKKVLIVTVPVYVLASYASDQGVKTSDGIFRSQAKALRLTLLRDVSADQLRDSFKEAMKVNGVAVENDSFWSQLFARLDSDVSAGEIITFASVTDDEGMDHLIVAGRKTLTAKGVGLGNQFWRMWLGIPVDDGVAELKRSLVSGRLYP